jgi:hypothetical protein
MPRCHAAPALLRQTGMKQLMALLLVSGLMVPLLPTEAFSAKPSAAAPQKKAPRHKRHARHAKATPAATPSAEKTAPRPAAPAAE